MSVLKNIPSGYQQVMPYLIIPRALQFIEFTQDVFGATLKMKEMRDEHTVGHCEILIGESCIMFGEASGEFPTMNAGLFIYVADADETYSKALDAGATAVMPLSDQNYGRTGGILDPFGNTWWITSVSSQQ